MSLRKETYHKRLSDSEWETLGQIAQNLGYKNRSDYLTACAYLTIYGKLLPRYSKPEKPAEAGITKFRTLAEKIEEEQKEFFRILSKRNLKPILAKRDTKTMISSLRNEFEKEMFEHCKMVPTVEQMEKWTDIFKEMKGADLLEYRIKTMNTEVCL